VEAAPLSWRGKRVLVTGAGGFIGSHLAERLVELGARTRALVHYRSDDSRGGLNRSPSRGDLEIVAGDVRDRESVAAAMRDREVVFHLAALIGIPYSYHAPASYVQTNIEGTLNVVQAARHLGVERLVHTSTSEVYGTVRYVPIDEAHPLQAQSPYAASKVGADKLVESFVCSFDLPAVTLRPFNTYGPRQSARAVITTIITQALAGPRVRLGNVHPTRDLNYVTDTVEAFVRAGTAPDALGQTINIGSGRELSVADVSRLIGTLLGKDLVLDVDEARVRPRGSEVERLVADASLAKRVLGWQPTISLEEGLQRTITWIREHHDDYRPGQYVV
jgi:dTDP-glucose 4,6-dehydratase